LGYHPKNAQIGEFIMVYQGPTPADYENVRSLNFAFLTHMQTGIDGARYLEGIPHELVRRFQRLRQSEIGWLATTPFLLFSFRERDDSFWRSVLMDDKSGDLFAPALKPSDEAGRLVSAGLGFVWQLANRNPFAARLVCGASTHWCEQITERTIFHLLAVAGHRSDLLVLREKNDADLWKKLLYAGLSDEAETRRAAHISALQHVLTGQPSPAAWSAAACRSRNPQLKVAEDSKR
jgi:hypothetical protein